MARRRVQAGTLRLPWSCHNRVPTVSRHGRIKGLGGGESRR